MYIVEKQCVVLLMLWHIILIHPYHLLCDYDNSYNSKYLKLHCDSFFPLAYTLKSVLYKFQRKNGKLKNPTAVESSTSK